MIIDVLTLFPAMVEANLGESIIGRARANGLVTIRTFNIRDYSEDKRHRVDDTPYGGGRGMLMAPQPIDACWHAAADGDAPDVKRHTVYLSPRGRTFTQKIAEEYSRYDHLILLCGHYEGVDQRVIDELVDEELSVGDYVLTGGEMPACIVADAVCRLIDGVLPLPECHEKESFEGGLLEYPQYTRPPVWHGVSVPEVLLSGHHANIEAWRHEESLKLTRERRPDLLPPEDREPQGSPRSQKKAPPQITEVTPHGSAGALQKLLSRVRYAVDKYGMIEDGDRIAVGVSGGKDSLALLCALAEMRAFYPKKYELTALMIDAGFDRSEYVAAHRREGAYSGDHAEVRELCRRLGVPFVIKRTEIARVVFDNRRESNPCSLCATMRRGALHDTTLALGCSKLALAHHYNDAVVTAMLILMFDGRFGCFSPVSFMSRKGLTVIRPLIYTEEKDVKVFVRRAGLPVETSPCPEDGNTQRAWMQEYLRDFDRGHRGINARVINALEKGKIDGWR